MVIFVGFPPCNSAWFSIQFYDFGCMITCWYESNTSGKTHGVTAFPSTPWLRSGPIWQTLIYEFSWKTVHPSFPERFQEGHNRRSRVQGPGLGVGWCWFLNPHVGRISPDTFSFNSSFGIHLWYKNFSKCGCHSKQTQDAVQIDRPYYLCLRDNMVPHSGLPF